MLSLVCFLIVLGALVIVHEFGHFIIAKRLGVHPAVVCVKWAVQRGQTPIPFSTKRRNYLSNLKGVVGEPLADDEMKEIAGIDKNCRLIKGQVFLWKEGQSWEDLWDLNGEITPP